MKTCFICGVEEGGTHLFPHPPRWIESKEETINHPQHYGGDTTYECRKVLKAWLTPEEYKGWLKGDAIKYICRLGKKGPPAEDAAKARFYINDLVNFLEEEEKNDAGK